MTERGDDYDISWPEGSIFGIVWTLIYSLIFSSFMVYMWKLAPNNFLAFKDYFDIWDGTMLVFIFNIVLNKLWSLVFMDGSIEAMEYIIDEDSRGSKPNTMSLTVGPIILFVLLASSIVVEVLLGLQNQWAAFGLYAPYVLWLFYALYLNVSVSRYIQNRIDSIHPIRL
jgi:tryptophan-rich sensory protein